MKPLQVSKTYTDFSRWSPRPALYWALRPQKAFKRLLSEPMTLAVRIRPGSDPVLCGRPAMTRWSYDLERSGPRLLLTLEHGGDLTNLDGRWRAVASTLWRLILKRPDIRFEEVPVDLGDGASDLPDYVFVLARPRGTRHPLLPTTSLLRERKPVPAARPWARKTGQLYFRGALTGHPDLDRNSRVALCRLAGQLPDTDCKLTRLEHARPEVRAQLEQEGLASRRMPFTDMNKHRFLADVDGHTTSWDRYMLIGAFGGVPVLFEPGWEECWHGELKDGENCVLTDRHTLGDALERLRADDARARHIAAGAAALANRWLSPAGAQEMFEQRWLARIEGSKGAGTLSPAEGLVERA
jgi:hypothetical protein